MTVINLYLAVLLIMSASCQRPEFKCETDSTPSFSYYGRSFRNKCTFSYIQSTADMITAKAAMTGLTIGTEAVYSLVFVNSSLSELPERFASTYNNIRKLDASRMTIQNIASTAFFGLKFWDVIDLSNNNIQTVKARTFASMNIKELDLSQNSIAVIEDTAFAGAEIERLHLHFNQLKSIRFLNSMGYFRLVGLNNNEFTSVDQLEPKKDGWNNRRASSFGEPEYPKIFFQNNKLTKFNCSSTIRLEVVDLESNQDLAEISLNQCAVDEVDVTNCPRLLKVSLNDNLEGFTARNVKINDIDLSSTKSLTTVSLANSSISPALFDKIMKMENLTSLDLSYNDIGPLNISTFAKLKNLQYLILKSTNISNIEFGTFSHQAQVKQLDVSDNGLKYFDMNMIFAMTHLLSLDLAGNELSTLENFDSAHYTFTLLQKIDLSNNTWPCSYLLRLIKVCRAYKVLMISSSLEEQGPNIHGIKCIHIPGQDDVMIEPLEAGSSNLTDIREKMNEVINQMDRKSQTITALETRIRQLEINKASSEIVSAALRSGEKSQSVEVRNGTLLESALVIVCICFTVFMAMKAFSFVRDNFFRTRKTMRSNSEHTLAMAVDDY